MGFSISLESCLKPPSIRWKTSGEPRVFLHIINMATLKKNMGSNPVMAWAHAGRFVEIRKVFFSRKRQDETWKSWMSSFHVSPRDSQALVIRRLLILQFEWRGFVGVILNDSGSGDFVDLFLFVSWLVCWNLFYFLKDPACVLSVFVCDLCRLWACFH